MMGRGAYFHGNHFTKIDARSYGIDPIVSLESASENNRSTLINRMLVEDALGEIKTDNSNGHGSVPHYRPGLYLRDRVDGVHPIAYETTRNGDTLVGRKEQAVIPTDKPAETVLIYLSYHERECGGIRILHSGKPKRTSKARKRPPKRRQTVEPSISHMTATIACAGYYPPSFGCSIRLALTSAQTLCQHPHSGISRIEKVVERLLSSST